MNPRQQPKPAFPPDETALIEKGDRRYAKGSIGTLVSPHDFYRRRGTLRCCDACFAPKSMHPRTEWVKARPLGENYYLAPSAPHFKEGW